MSINFNCILYNNVIKCTDENICLLNIIKESQQQETGKTLQGRVPYIKMIWSLDDRDPDMLG